MPELGPIEAMERVVALNEEDADTTHTHGIYYTGSDDGTAYYLVIMERVYDGRRYLNERYVALSLDEDDDFEDTFMSNGINRRLSTNLAEKLSEAYAGVAERRKMFGNGEQPPEETNPMFGVVDDE